MVNAATFAVAAAVATTAFAAPALEARRRGGRAGSRVSQSSRTDKIATGIGAAQLATDVVGLALPKRDLEFVEVEARRRRAGGRSGPRSSTTDKISAGIGAAQLATDVAGLVIPKDVESADFEARDFSDDELETRDLEDLGARWIKVKTLRPVTDPKTGETYVKKGKRDFDSEDLEARDFSDDELEARDFEELEARRRRAGGRSGPRSSTTAKLQAGIDGAQLATDVAGLVIPKRDLEPVEVEARRRRGARGGALGRSGSRMGGNAQLAVMKRDFEELEARRFKVKTLQTVKTGTGETVVRKPKRDLEFVEVEARRRRAGGRSGPRSSTTDKISAGIGAAQLATDVAGLVIPKDVDSADFEARDFSDDELEARDLEELEARRFKVKTLQTVKTGTGETVVRKPKRDLEFVEVEARRRRAGGRSGPRSSTTAKIQAGIDGAQLATDVAGLVIPKRDLEYVEVEARRRRGAGARRGSARLAVENGQVGTGGGQMAPGLIGLAARDFEDLEARRRRAGGRSGPRSSTTAKIQAGIDGAQLATDVVGLALPKRDLEFVEVEARRRRGAGSRGSALRSGGARTHVAAVRPDVMRRDFEELEARRRRAGGARRGPRSSTTDKISAGIGAAQLATDVAGLVTAREFDLELLD